MAQLAAWIPLVYLDKLFTLPSKLVLQHVREHIPAIVSYGFAKAELAIFFLLCHRFDANVLNANGIIAVCKVARLKVRLKTESWQFFTKRKNASYCVRYGKEGCNKMSPQRVAGRPTLLSVLITGPVPDGLERFWDGPYGIAVRRWE
jgi:hypothetical protein